VIQPLRVAGKNAAIEWSIIRTGLRFSIQ
jgi:hypothetical protein